MGKYDRFLEGAHIATRESEMELSAAHERIRNTQNLALLYFFREMRKLVQGTTREGAGSKSDENLLYALPTVMGAVREALPRLRSAKQLVEIKQCGTYLATIVESVLWKEYPPHPPDEDELEAEADLAANKEACKAREKEKEKALRAAAKKAADGSGEGEMTEGAEGRDGLLFDAAAPTQKQRKLATRQPKAYVPLAGTSAYAFLILMYQELKRGHGELLKDELMKLVDASGLSNKPIYGNRNSAAKPGEMHYDGWATMNKTLISKGFVSARGSPKKVKLSVEGVILAAHMYKDALLRGKIEAVPGTDPDADIAQYQALLPPPIPEAAGTSSQANPAVSDAEEEPGSTQPQGSQSRRMQSQNLSAGLSQQQQQQQQSLTEPSQQPKKRRKAADSSDRHHMLSFDSLPRMGESVVPPNLGGPQAPQQSRGTDRHHLTSFDSLPAMGVSALAQNLGAQASQLSRQEHGWLNAGTQGQGTPSQGGGQGRPSGSGGRAAWGGGRASGSSGQWGRGGRVGWSREEQIAAAKERERRLLYDDGGRPRGHFDEEAEDTFVPGQEEDTFVIDGGEDTVGGSDAVPGRGGGGWRQASGSAWVNPSTLPHSHQQQHQHQHQPQPQPNHQQQQQQQGGGGWGQANGSTWMHGNNAQQPQQQQQQQQQHYLQQQQHHHPQQSQQQLQSQPWGNGRAGGSSALNVPLPSTGNQPSYHQQGTDARKAPIEVITLDSDSESDVDPPVSRPVKAFPIGSVVISDSSIRADRTGVPDTKEGGDGTASQPRSRAAAPAASMMSLDVSLTESQTHSVVQHTFTARSTATTHAGRLAGASSGCLAAGSGGQACSGGDPALGARGGAVECGGVGAESPSAGASKSRKAVVREGPSISLPAGPSVSGGSAAVLQRTGSVQQLPPRPSSSSAGGSAQRPPVAPRTAQRGATSRVTAQPLSTVPATASATVSAPAPVPILSAPEWNIPSVSEEGMFEDVMLRLPPLSPGQLFESVYEVVLVLDMREQLSRVHTSGPGAMSKSDNLMMHVNAIRAKGVAVEVKHLAVGDALWLARCRSDPQKEYVLDFIVERKSVRDLDMSIMDGRYVQQKWWLDRCGLKHVMYLLEGSPEGMMHTAEHCIKRVKTAACGTELDGLVLIRTLGVQDTLAWYARLTKSITATYAKRSTESLHKAIQTMATAAVAKQSMGMEVAAAGVGSQATGAAHEAFSPQPTVASEGTSMRQDAAALPLAGQGAAGEVLPLFGIWNTRVTRIRAANDVGNVFGLMLCAVPGVSETNAKAVMAHYSTALALWQAYKAAIQGAMAGGADGTAAARCLLQRQAGLQPGLSQKIYDTLFCNGAGM